MKQEKEKKVRPSFDGMKCDKVAGDLATEISRQIAESHPQSIAEGLLTMTIAMGRVIHMLSALMGVDPKRLCRDFCGSLTRYSEMGGDIDTGAVVDALLKRKGN
jgi:hypothetical protein